MRLEQIEVIASSSGAVAAMLREAGMEVVYVGRFATPATLSAAAFDEGADVATIRRLARD
ncbi:MAG: hypothetical protein ACREQJ_18825 [Candidatus Binatia bacterium]